MKLKPKNHHHIASCKYCTIPKSKGGSVPFLGICGSLSCYFAMFPAVFLGIIGILGLSIPAAVSALNAYMSSFLFQPILLVSILALIIGLWGFGTLPIILATLGGIGVFVSMNFYMQAWFFTLSFATIAVAYFLAYKVSKLPNLRVALVVIMAVVILGAVEVVRIVAQTTKPTIKPTDTMQMMKL